MESPRVTDSFPSYDLAAYSDLFDKLFPICRSITGPGLRDTLRVFSKYMPLQVEAIRTGETVFDWTAPQEWEISSARLTGPNNEVVCDFSDSNLHVVNYSCPVDAEMSLDELRPHLHGLPSDPSAIPYVTSYYRDTWGFCLPQAKIDALPPGNYRAKIDSRKYDGEVNFASCTLAGDMSAEFLLSSYICHPSLANNELSGPLVLLGLFDRISKWPRRRFTYRFLLAPETIGSLCFLREHGTHLKNTMAAGLVLTCLGGPDTRLSYKTSRRGNTTLDRLIEHRISTGHYDCDVRPFTPIDGSDERQFCSPGFNLPVGQIARTTYGYREYHTSLDDKEFMDISQILRSVDEIEALLLEHEYSGVFKNQAPYGEPQLGKRGLYPNLNSPTKWQHSTDGVADGRHFRNRILYILNYSDGEHSMLDIATKLGCSISDLIGPVDALEEKGLLRVHS